MIYSINGEVSSVPVTAEFDIVIEDLLDGKLYRVAFDADNNLYSEEVTGKTPKMWVFQDINSRAFYKVISQNGNISVAPYVAATGDVDLSVVYAKLDQLLNCACDKNVGTKLPFKMYGIE